MPLPSGLPLQSFLLGDVGSVQEHTPRMVVEEILTGETAG